VHNCETSWGLLYFHLLSPLSRDQIPFDPHHHSAQLREQGKDARQRDGEECACSQVVSDTYYYAYRLHVRDGPQPPLFYGGKLFQQFVVDAWANCEQRKLN